MCFDCNNEGKMNEMSQEESIEKETQAVYQELEETREALARCQEQQRYLQADFENFRRNMAKERTHWSEQAKVSVIRDLLPIIDTFERAVQDLDGLSAEESVVSRLKGISLIYRECLSLLERLRVEVIATELFDPYMHEAVAHVPIAGKPSGVVVEVLQKGYRMGDIIIRPARVAVAQ